MAIFNNMSITNKGQLLYAKAQAGTELHFTKMQIGSGVIGVQNPATLTALITPKYDVTLQSITANTETKTATISGLINNSNITQATYICEIGLFAQDPDDGEILYAYGSAGTYGDYMAPASSGPYSWSYQINAAVGNAANVTIELSNLNYDSGVVNTNATLIFLQGGNQKEINKSIDNLFKLYPTTNSGNVYSITASDFTFKDGYPLRVKFNAASTGTTSLKINANTAKPIKDYFGNNVSNIRQNLIANLAYESSSDSFILQGKGGDGNATAPVIVAPYTATTAAGPVTGTLADNYNTDNIECTPSVSGTTLRLTIPTTARYKQGNHLQVTDSNFSSSNILYGSTVLGKVGSAIPSKYGTFSGSSSSDITINLGFQPNFIGVTSANGGDLRFYSNSNVGINSLSYYGGTSTNGTASATNNITPTATGFIWTYHSDGTYRYFAG
jgi:hypothetical protein